MVRELVLEEGPVRVLVVRELVVEEGVLRVLVVRKLVVGEGAVRDVWGPRRHSRCG